MGRNVLAEAADGDHAGKRDQQEADRGHRGAVDDQEAHGEDEHDHDESDELAGPAAALMFEAGVDHQLDHGRGDRDRGEAPGEERQAGWHGTMLAHRTSRRQPPAAHEPGAQGTRTR